MLDSDFYKKTNKIAFWLTILLLCIAFVVLKSGADLDLWHRMAVGKIFSQTGWVIYHDIFTYFPAKEMWVDHEWLSGVVFYYIGHYLGDAGIMTLQISIIFAIMYLIYQIKQLLYPDNKYPIGFYFMVLFAIIPGVIASIRCQSFTYLFFTLWLYLLERVRQGETRLIWIFPATMLLWANLHGGFLAGFGLVGFYIIGEFLNKKDVSRYLLILAVSLPVTLINPYGLTYWSYMLDAVSMNRPYITEWQPFNPLKGFYNQPGVKLLFLLILPGIVLKLARKSFDNDKVKLAALIIPLILSLKSERHIVFFAITLACFCYNDFISYINTINHKIKEFIGKKVDNDTYEKLNFAKFSFVYGLIIMIASYVILTSPISVKMGEYPTNALNFIKINNISGNLFIPFNWGSYALWKQYPKNLVNIDGRYEETYTNEAYLDTCKLTFALDGWREILNKYNHEILLLEKDSRIYKKVKVLSDWKIAYQDEKAAVFLKDSTGKANWKQPIQADEYYIKTKYDNELNF